MIFGSIKGCFMFNNFKRPKLMRLNFLNTIHTKIFLILVIMFLFSPSVFSKRLYKEAVYQAHWCNARNGIMEYEIDDKTRVDCLLPNMAVEFDFASKWAECIGQALYYGLKTDKKPACVLIIENEDKELKYLKRLEYASNRVKPKIKVLTIKPDELNITKEK